MNLEQVTVKQMVLETRRKAIEEGYLPEYLNISRNMYDSLYFEETKNYMIPTPMGTTYYGMKVNIIEPSSSMSITGKREKDFKWI